MMMRVRLSRWANHRLFDGDPEMMISSRVYIEDHTVCRVLIDVLFWYLRGEIGHCCNSYHYDLTGEEL